jgi:hypothetical protein
MVRSASSVRPWARRAIAQLLKSVLAVSVSSRPSAVRRADARSNARLASRLRPASS